MNDSNVTADKVDDKTIQWARESLQRRRIELRAQREELIASYQAGSSSSSAPSPATSSNASVQHPMIERGRALLAEAEARAEILRRYASFRDGIIVASPPPPPPCDSGDAPDRSPVTTTARGTNSTIERNDDDIAAATLVQGTSRVGERPAGSRTTCDSESTPKQPRTISIDLPVECPYWECEYEEGDFPSSDEDEPKDRDEGMKTPLTEGEARERLDELIAALRRRRDDEMASEDTPTKRIATFDPSSMNAAKRAALRKTKLDEGVAAAEEEARLMTSFRALPLPGGAEVRNNLFASTRAFQGKQIGPVEKSVRRDHKKCEQNEDASSSLSGTFDACDGFSTATSRTGREDSFGASAFGNEADRERERIMLAEKKMKKRHIIDAINRIVMEEMQPASIEEDGSAVPDEGFDVVEDPSKLLQDIAQLKAKLKQKKTQRLAILNDMVDIDLNAPFDRLLSGDAGVEMRCIIDQLKERVCGVNVDDFYIAHAVGKRVDDSHIRVPRRGSVFIRQVEWAKQREQKLFNARLQQEADAMDGITGTPQVSHTTESWKWARDSHDDTLRRFAEEESMKRQQREAKEKAMAELKDKEIEELQKQANAKVKSMKTEVDKEEQMKRIESLSRPRQTKEILANVESCADIVEEEQQQPYLTSKSKVYLSPKPQKKTNALKDERFEHDEKAKKYFNSISDVTPNEFCGKSSFAEMSDKEFAKLIKSIGKNAF